MSQKSPRTAVWAVALMTVFALFGTHSAFALNTSQPRVEAAGWIGTMAGASQCNNGSFTSEVKLGVTGNYSSSMQPQGHFEYFNTCSGVSVHGNVTSITTGGAACNSGKAVHVVGTCDNNSSGCSFSADLLDGGNGSNNSSKSGPIDYVCGFSVTGADKYGAAAAETDGPNPLQRGNITVQGVQ